MQRTGLSQRYRVNPKIVSETIDGEVIVLNLDRGRYYSLTLSGADAWNALQRSATPREIVEDLLSRYSADRAEVEPAVVGLMEDLHREELILPVTEDVPAARPAPERPAEHREGRPAFQPPVLQAYTDMEDLLLLDPIHEVDESGWPNRKADDAAPTS